MNIKMLKGLFPAMLLFAGTGGCHQVPVRIATTGIQSLGFEETATDAFTFTCPGETVSAQANVEDVTKAGSIPALMRVMLFKDGNAAQEEDLPFRTDDQPSDEGGEPSSLYKKDIGAAEAEVSDAATYVRPSGRSKGPSPNAVLRKGSGLYLMIFYKTGEGVKTYSGSAACQTATGRSVPTILKKVQNQ